MRRSGLMLCVLLTLLPISGAEADTRSLSPSDALALAASGAGTVIAQAPLFEQARPRADIEALSPSQQDSVHAVLDAIDQAAQLHRSAWAAVAPDSVTRSLGDPGASSTLLAHLDRGQLLAASAGLIRVVEANLKALSEIRLTEPTCFDGAVLCIGTEGDDVWVEDVQILIDPAGDDLYLNNAGGSLQTSIVAASGGCVLGGGSTGSGRPNLDCSPAPSNACTYDTLNQATGRDDLPKLGLPGHDDPSSSEGGNGSDGSCGNDERAQRVRDGITGLQGDPDARAITLLIDADGSDIYTAPWSHEDPLFNLIEDCFPGELDKVNTNRDFIQGASLAGISLTWDAGAGEDIFRGRLNAQGSGHIGGVGMLVVQGEGDNTFWADRLSQASGTAAGIGLLVNGATGAQRYLLDPPQIYRNEFAPNSRDCQAEGRAGQGQGGFGGVGVLVTDGGTTSSYRAITHVIENAYPYRSVIDSAGTPRLARGTDAQGSGESFPIVATSGGLVAGVGILIDRTDGDTRTCSGHAKAGMLSGSASASGTSLDTMGSIDATCGKFNLPSELNPSGDPATVLQRLTAGALGLRLVIPR